MSDSSGRVETGANATADGTAQIESLLGDDAEPFEEVLTGQSPGPLAVCGPPFGGREQVLEHAADRLGIDTVRLDPDDGAEPLLSALERGPVVINDCQHLYERRIGGFEPLDSVLRAIDGRDEIVITGWNAYAWDYLARVRGINRTFAATADIGPMRAADLAALILERYDDIPVLTPDQTDSGGLLSIRHHEIAWRGHSLSIPVPTLNRAVLTATLNDGDTDPEDVVFERLASISKGNVGVATAIWEASRRDEVRPSDIVASGADLDFTREEAFCLRILLLKERVTRAELTRIIEETERVLGRLLRDNLVSIDDDVVHLDPAVVPTVVSETERRRLQ